MRKLLYASVGSALAAALLATPAAADVTVTASLTKDKDVFVVEYIIKYKYVFLFAYVDVILDGAAEALAIANVTNSYNVVYQSQQDGVPLTNDYDIYRRAAIDNSINDNAGIVELNQDVGNMANQGNVLAFSEAYPSGGEPAPRTFVEAEAWVEQINGDPLDGGVQTEFSGNSVTHLEDPADVPAFNPNTTQGNVVALMRDSITSNNGIVGVNQNAGNMANQTNAVALAVGFGVVVALSEAALGQTNAGNSVFEAGVKKSASINNSINFNNGVVHVNQSAGNMANQSNVFALAFVVGGP
jgi:hypothetical protein